MPAGGGRAAYPEFSGNLGLREPPLQVLCGHQAPALHFVARQNALCGCFHGLLRGYLSARAIPEYQKTFRMQIVFCRNFSVPTPCGAPSPKSGYPWGPGGAKILTARQRGNPGSERPPPGARHSSYACICRSLRCSRRSFASSFSRLSHRVHR